MAHSMSMAKYRTEEVYSILTYVRELASPRETSFS